MTKQLRYNPDITFTQQAYEHIKNGIIEGKFKPNEKLKVITLRTMLGIGTAPIREALSQLVTTGLVTFTDNKGFRVATVSEQDVRDIYAIFTLIETIILTRSFEEGDKKWAADVLATFTTLEEIENRKLRAPLSEWSKANYAFHRALLAGCTSQSLLDIQAMLYLKFERYAHMAYNLNPELITKNHSREKKEHHVTFAQLAKSRDIKKAVELMAYHINAPLEDIIQTLKDKHLI
jgi:GntR family carbon starvation induced transcriptional regulator